jgi:hypothetical protein
MSADALLIAVVVVLAVIHGVMHYRDAVAERRRERALRLIISYMTVWAETWGEPAPVVREALSHAREQSGL